MPLERLAIHQLRNLMAVDITPSPSLNFIFGDNGSGKTSLLEAMSVLAHGRSFRTLKFRRLISHEQTQFSLFAQLNTQGISATLGVQRGLKGEAVYRLNGVNVQSSASLATQLPLQVMNGKSFTLLEGPSKMRRQLFDWLVFHVKHDFGVLWRDYSRCLKQRNSLLRHGTLSPLEARPWNKELARLGELIHAARQACLPDYLQAVTYLLQQAGFPSYFTIGLEYEPGWDTAKPLFDQLEDHWARDLRYGYTTLGAHKSELKISAQKTLAHEVLSRGQQKTLIAALYVAQLQVYQQINPVPCVLLIDDLPAELDQHHITLLGKWINQLNIQVFITGIALTGLVDAWPASSKPTKVFHVKQGEIVEYHA